MLIFLLFSGHIFAAKFIPGKCCFKSCWKIYFVKYKIMASVDTHFPLIFAVSHSLEKELIRREIDIMNQLHHPKLINLHDAFEDDDEMVLIYEL